MLAAERGHKDIVEMLISIGAAINIRDSMDRGALELAITMGHKETVALLLKHKIQITAQIRHVFAGSNKYEINHILDV